MGAGRGKARRARVIHAEPDDERIARSMDVVLLVGPPGAGKGTAAKKLSERYGAAHLSTGDILRTAIKEETEVGKLADKIIHEGNLMPDDITIKLIAESKAFQAGEQPVLLDGFPRNLAQADLLSDLLADLGRDVSHVIFLDPPERDLYKRIVDRRSCADCGRSCSPQDTTCPGCGGEVTRRKDDNEVALGSRLEVYRDVTLPVVEDDRYQDKLIHIDSEESEQLVFQEIRSALAENAATY